MPAEDVRGGGSPRLLLLVLVVSPPKNIGDIPVGHFGGGAMGTAQPHESTLVFRGAQAGDERARDELIAMVYDELRRVAAGLMRRERIDHTLSPTAVVHEAMIRLLGAAVFDKGKDRSYLFASAARAMREVLVDHARRRAADRRGGGRRRVPLDHVLDYFEGQDLDVIAVHEALDRLAEWNPRQSQIMTLRYFGGLTVPEIADAMGISVVTVERDCRLARAWLGGQLQGGRE
jgi:RNA polymerase sigma-70 factor, ECF subfamily